MLIHVNGTCASAIRITAGGIVPHSACARCKPDVERIEEDPVRIIWIHGDSLVVPVLGIVALATSAVSKRAALRTLHVTPGCAAVRRSPGAKLASVRVAATAVAIWSNRLALCINVVRVAWRDSKLDPPQLIASRGIDKRAASACVHARPCRVRAAGILITEDEPIGVTGDGRKTRAAARAHGGTVKSISTVVAQVILNRRGKPSGADRSDDPSGASHIA